MDGIQFVAKVSVNNGVLNVKLNRWENLGGLSKSLAINLKDIESVEVLEEPTWRNLGWRLAGTHLPAVVSLGHFRKEKKSLLVFWVRGHQAVVINLNSGPYKQLVLGVNDAEALAKELTLGV
jgi:hypothetical protein